MAGPIALVGGDEFRDGCEPMDREILAVAGSGRPRVLIVPTAAAQQNPAKAAANGVAYFNGLGAEADALMVLDSEDADNDGLVSRVGWADVIYLTGGDPAHLLEVLRGSRLLDAIRAAVAGGAVLAGSSAGRDGAGRVDAVRRRTPGAWTPGRPRGASPPRGQQPGRGRRRACGGSVYPE